MKQLSILIALLMVGCNSKKTYLDGSTCDCDSIRSEYYSDGKVWMDSPYRDGKVNGLRKVYFQNGNVLRVVEYVNGEENGTLVDYTPNGEVRVTAEFINGVINH